MNKAIASSTYTLKLMSRTDDASGAAPENKIWEDDYLRDGRIAKMLKERTILYRIVAESPEALNLYAFLPKPENLPCLVVIK